MSDIEDTLTNITSVEDTKKRIFVVYFFDSYKSKKLGNFFRYNDEFYEYSINLNEKIIMIYRVKKINYMKQYFILSSKIFAEKIILRAFNKIKEEKKTI